MNTHPLFDPFLAPRIVVSPNGCWIWAGYTNGMGYGKADISGKQVYAQR